MPDQPIPIPSDLDLCGSIADQTLFIQLLNLNFEYLVKVIEQNVGISLTLPGVPPMFIPGFPGIQIPGLAPFDIGIQAERQSLETAWIGNRILRGVPYDKRRATGQYGGTPGATIGGVDLSIPGADPMTVTMQYVALNFQLITQLVPQITTLPLFLAGGPGSLCSLPPEVRQPLINQIIDAINGQFQNAIPPGGGAPCVPILTPPFTNIDPWFDQFTSVLFNQTLTRLTATSFRMNFNGGTNTFGGDFTTGGVFSRTGCAHAQMQFDYNIDVVMNTPNLVPGAFVELQAFIVGSGLVYFFNQTFPIPAFSTGETFSGSVNQVVDISALGSTLSLQIAFSGAIRIDPGPNTAELTVTNFSATTQP